jgi:hypothetical protein
MTATNPIASDLSVAKIHDMPARKATMIAAKVLKAQQPFTFVHNVVSVVLATVAVVLVAVAVAVKRRHR